MKLIELRAMHAESTRMADSIFAKAVGEGRELTTAEQRNRDYHLEQRAGFAAQIQAADSAPGSLRRALGGDFTRLITGGTPPAARGSSVPMSAEYTESFLTFLRTGGKQRGDALLEGFDDMGGYALPSLPGMTAALYEGSNAAGGYALNVTTDPIINPLALPDMGMRSLAQVIPTDHNINLPLQSAFGSAAVKAESGASTNSFAESDPTLSQVALSAFALGAYYKLSWELLQDVSTFQSFAVEDLMRAVLLEEDTFFVGGSGTAQPQGVLGNVESGTGAPYLVESTGAYLLNALDDVQATLKGEYFANAGWLMQRATGAAIQKFQRQSNLFAPIWTREAGRDFLHGFPVAYSANMPALPTATNAGVTPVLFGDFKSAYVIGDRGGSGISVKVLDQPFALSGQTALLAYRRADGRVRRSEAVQGISISHS